MLQVLAPQRRLRSLRLGAVTLSEHMSTGDRHHGATIQCPLEASLTLLSSLQSLDAPESFEYGFLAHQNFASLESLV
jgi:hypothetical protein